MTIFLITSDHPINKNKIRKLTLRPPALSSTKTAQTQPTCQKSINNPTTIKLCLNKKTLIRQERIISQMLLSEPFNLLKNITSKTFSIIPVFFSSHHIFLNRYFRINPLSLCNFLHNFLFTPQNLHQPCKNYLTTSSGTIFQQSSKC